MKRILILTLFIIMLANVSYASAKQALELAKRTTNAYKTVLKKQQVKDGDITNLMSRPYFEWKIVAGIKSYSYVLTKKNNVYNSMGQIVKSSLIEKTITNIDATNLANGIYYISLQNSYNFTPLKFIKI